MNQLQELLHPLHVTNVVKHLALVKNLKSIHIDQGEKNHNNNFTVFLLHSIFKAIHFLASLYQMFSKSLSLVLVEEVLEENSNVLSIFLKNIIFFPNLIFRKTNSKSNRHITS